MAFADLVLDLMDYPLNYTFDPENINFPLNNLRLLGVMGIMDPPRQEVNFLNYFIVLSIDQNFTYLIHTAMITCPKKRYVLREFFPKYNYWKIP